MAVDQFKNQYAAPKNCQYECRTAGYAHTPRIHSALGTYLVRLCAEPRPQKRIKSAEERHVYGACPCEPSSEPLLSLAQGRLHFLCTELHAQLHAWCRSNEKTGLRTTAHIQPIVLVNPGVGGLTEHTWHRGGRRVHGASGAPSPRFQARHLSDSQRVANEAGSHRPHVRTGDANRLLAARHTPRGAVLEHAGKRYTPSWRVCFRWSGRFDVNNLSFVFAVYLAFLCAKQTWRDRRR